MQMKIGDKLYDSNLKEYVVSKIGNKYFECENQRGRFNIEKLCYDTTYSTFYLTYDKQGIIDKKERDKLESLIRNIIKPYGNSELSLHTLRRIKDILDSTGI